MRVMVIVKATKDSEAGIMPTTELLEAMGRLFGTDGVRGEFGRDLTTGLARDLGRAAVVVLSRHERRPPTFVIGRDTRASGEPLEAALVEGITRAGGNAYLVGVEPTDPATFAAMVFGFLVIAAIACGLPALRASRLDPMVALRDD